MELEQQIDKAGLVEDDWNGYGSQAPSAPSCAFARWLLSRLKELGGLPRSAVPHGGGGVALCFPTTSLHKSRIEVWNDGDLLFYFSTGDGLILEDVDRTDDLAVDEAIKRLIERRVLPG